MSDEDRAKVDKWYKSWQGAIESPKEFLSRNLDEYCSVLESYEKVKKMRKFTHIIEILENCCIKCFRSWCYEVECRKFYECFEARTYIITSGKGPYGHPDMEVLNGIALAAVQRSEKCQIVLTNSVGLEFWKFSEVFDKPNDRISVWYLDDGNLRTKPYISIDPLHDPLYEEQSVDSEKCKGMTKLELGTTLQDWEQSLQCLLSNNLLEILKATKQVDPPDAIGDPFLLDYLKILGHEGDITFSTLWSTCLATKLPVNCPLPILIQFWEILVGTHGK